MSNEQLERNAVTSNTGKLKVVKNGWRNRPIHVTSPFAMKLAFISLLDPALPTLSYGRNEYSSKYELDEFLTRDEWWQWKKTYGVADTTRIDQLDAALAWQNNPGAKAGGETGARSKEDYEEVLLFGVQEIASFPTIRAGLLTKKWGAVNGPPAWWNLFKRTGQDRIIQLTAARLARGEKPGGGWSGTWGTLGPCYTPEQARRASEHRANWGGSELPTDDGDRAEDLFWLWGREWTENFWQVQLFNPDALADPAYWSGISVEGRGAVPRGNGRGEVGGAPAAAKKARRGGKEARRRHNAKRFARQLLRIQEQGSLLRDWDNEWARDIIEREPDLLERARQWLPAGWTPT
jgi:hypothetical protein